MASIYTTYLSGAGYILLSVVALLVLVYLFDPTFGLKCIPSEVDGNTYCVRERPKLELAANLLATITSRCKRLVVFCGQRYPDNEAVRRLVLQFNPTRISETLPSSNHTAYSENKGEKIAFCLNTHKNGNKLIDTNTLMFVAIHELAHVMTQSIGHTEEFWSNFKFLITNAKEMGIYAPVDYKRTPQPYCGMDINDNPYYDFHASKEK
jgi:hypothetical protein